MSAISNPDVAFGIQIDDLRSHIVRPVLRHLDCWSEAAEELVLGTALTENYRGAPVSLDQDGGGPAIGLWQQEPATRIDIENNYLVYRPNLKARMDMLYMVWPLPDVQLHGNLYLAAAMCRIQYWRQAEALPEAGDYEGQGAYYKEYYNTPLGAGSAEGYVEAVKGML
jgi:hypothetical protein